MKTHKCVQLCLGQHLKLVGSSPVLGEWDFCAAPAFTWSPDHMWQLQVQLPLDAPVDWKIVQAVEGNNEWCEWQSGENTIVDPSALGLSSGDVLQVGCSWEGPVRATIIEPASPSSGASTTTQPELIRVTEEPVYGSDEFLDEGAVSETISAVTPAVPSPSAPQAAVEMESTQDATGQAGQGEEPAEKSRGFGLSVFGWGGKGDKATEAAAVVPTSEPTAPPQSEPTSAKPGVAPEASAAPAAAAPEGPGPAESSDSPTQSAEWPAAAKPLAASLWDSVPAQQQVAPRPAAAQGEAAPAPAAAPDAVPAPAAAQEPNAAAETELSPAPATAEEPAEDTAAGADPKIAEDTLKALQASGSGADHLLMH